MVTESPREDSISSDTKSYRLNKRLLVVCLAQHRCPAVGDIIAVIALPSKSQSRDGDYPAAPLTHVPALATPFQCPRHPSLPALPSLPPGVFPVVSSPCSSHLCPSPAPAPCHPASSSRREHMARPGGRSPWSTHPSPFPTFVWCQLFATLDFQLLLTPHHPPPFPRFSLSPHPVAPFGSR